MRWARSRTSRKTGRFEIHPRKICIEPACCPPAGRSQKAGRIAGQFARIKRNTPPIGQTATHGIKDHAVTRDFIFDRAAQTGEGQCLRLGPSEIRLRLGLDVAALVSRAASLRDAASPRIAG